MVPNGWREGKVKDLVKSLDAGVSVNSEDDGNINSEFKILKTSCVSTGIFRPKKAKSVVDSKEVARLKEPVKADSIIISRMNTPALVGANGYVETEILNSFLPDRLWQVKPRDNKVNMKWLGYWFSSSHTRYALSSTATGTSGSMKNITKPDVLNIKINIPPLPEQQKIAKVLSTWDKAISTTERLIENSTQQKKALMQQLLTGKKRLLNESEKMFEGEWEEVELSKWLVENKEKSIVQDQYDVYTSSRNGLVLQSEYFANSRIAERDNIGFHVIPPDHITYRSRSDDGFFTFNLFSSDKKGLISNYYPVFSTKGSNVFFIALFEQYRSVFGRYSVGTSQKVLSLNALKDILFKIPSIQEQQKIATVLTNADKEIELLEQQLADLQQEKKALMQQLLTGKKRVVVDGEG